MKIYVLNYVDDMLYFSTDADKLKQFEEKLRARFNLELIRQAHWYLGTRINKLANYDIELDQSRYCASIVKKYSWFTKSCHFYFQKLCTIDVIHP